MKELYFCTIASKNHLARVRALTESLLAHHPHTKIFWLAVDNIENFIDSSKERMEVIRAHALKNVPSIKEMFFKYNAFEVACALKPYFIEYLFMTYDVKKLVYLDSDMYVMAKMDELSSLLKKFAIILTPHIIGQLPADDSFVNELSLLRYGIFNLGFIALANVPEAASFLSWWKKRLWHFALCSLEEGMNVDQKWIDFVPSLFDKVHILNKPGYNVAFWNLHERKLAFLDGKIIVNGEVLRLFHFNSFYPNNLGPISKYQYQQRLVSFSASRALLKLYKKFLIKNGYDKICTWPYSYNHFDNGIPISDSARRVYWELGKGAKKFGNPFKTAGRDSFYKHYMNTVSVKSRRIYRIAEFCHRYRGWLKRYPITAMLTRKTYKLLTSMKS